MAALDFPSSPSVNDIYTANGKTFQWDGVSWLNITTSFGSPSANVDFSNNVLSQVTIKDYQMWHNALGTLTANTTIDLNAGNYVSATINGAVTFTFANSAPTANAGGFVFELTNGGSNTVTWPAATKWSNASAPVLTTAGVDVLVFITDDGGTTWRGVLSMQDSS